ncbi:amidase signature enzyme [Aureobasidium subglaciale]|nr:amidase signature enzyme [Aureobasidium subglaciale]KAI5218337.1 amidase signature enzyme [Aureobasidium subglaciale]KAI5221922.1 amidase signature enzyme [Aureobasidium subglaciale]KAI5259263.1 amidase signature enzyme [Aureobasidium subglaciale]
MSIISLAEGSLPTVSKEELHAAAKGRGFSIPVGSQDETDFLLLQNSFDAVASAVAALPEYIDPRVEPTPVEGGPRKWSRPSQGDNPLNAWSHKVAVSVLINISCQTHLKASAPTSKALSGKTLAMKDNVSVAGAPLRLGTAPELFKGGKYAISEIDATVVKRILEASGTISGTAVCENFSLFPTSVSADSGPVHNAWATGYMTGGSSSGCASVISAKDVRERSEKIGLTFKTNALEEEGVDMAIGGDQGGSIRAPASFGGFYGLKPTTGLVPYTGIVSILPMIDSTGPMARSIEDIALLLGVIAGYDGIDPRQTPETPLRQAVPDYTALLAEWQAAKREAGEWTASSAAKGLRIGILKEAWEIAGLNTDVAAIVRAAAERFGKLGAEVHEVSVPLHLQGPSIWTVAGREAIPRFFENRASDLLSHPLPGLEPNPTNQMFYDKLVYKNPAVINVVLNAEHMETKFGPSLTRKAHMLVHQLRAEYDKVFEKVDILITPTTPTVAGKHCNYTSVMEIAQKAVGVTLNTSPFNCSGHPGMSMPCGWSETADGEGKLPVGMQLVAKRWHEMDILKAASAWEVLGKGMDS